MNQLRIKLFGKLSVHFCEKLLSGCDSLKVKELLAFLLLNRDRPHSRETLASLLWGDSCTTQQSRKYLRNALWRLHSAIDVETGLNGTRLLVIDNGWIELRSTQALWLDVDVFESAYNEVLGISERELVDEHVRRLDEAISVYTGPLLSDWHQEWCTVERQRMQHLFLVMVEKVSGYYESKGRYEVSLSYAQRILRSDRAHERAHMRIMRLLNEMGDRTSALRQYQWCVGALKEELDAGPAPSTVRLYDQIRNSSEKMLGL